MSEALLDTTTDVNDAALEGRFFEPEEESGSSEILYDASRKFYEQYEDLILTGVAVVSQEWDVKAAEFTMPDPELALARIKRQQAGRNILKLLSYGIRWKKKSEQQIHTVNLISPDILTVTLDARQSAEGKFRWEFNEVDESGCQTISQLTVNGEGLLHGWHFELDGLGSVKKESSMSNDQMSRMQAELLLMLDEDGEITKHAAERSSRRQIAKEKIPDFIEAMEAKLAEFTDSHSFALSLYLEKLNQGFLNKSPDAQVAVRQEQERAVKNFNGSIESFRSGLQKKIEEERKLLGEIGFIAGRIFQPATEVENPPEKTFDQIDWSKTGGRLPLHVRSAGTRKRKELEDEREKENPISLIKKDPNHLLLPGIPEEDFMLETIKAVQLKRWEILGDFRFLAALEENLKTHKNASRTLRLAKSLDPSTASAELKEKVAHAAVDRQLASGAVHKAIGQMVFNPVCQALPNGLYRIGKNLYRRDNSGLYVVGKNAFGKTTYKTIAGYRQPNPYSGAGPEGLINLAEDLIARAR